MTRRPKMARQTKTATQGKPLVISRIPITKAKLQSLPQDTRRVLLLTGHVANEINTLNRLAMFSLKDQGDELLTAIAVGRAWVVIRVLLGKTHEALEFVKKRILRSPFGRRYLPLLALDGTKALDNVRRAMGNGKLLAQMRNKYAFHYDDDDGSLERAFQNMPADTDFSLYSSTARHTAWNLGPDLAVLYEMHERVGAPTISEAGEILSNLHDVAGDLNDLLEHIFIAVVEAENLMDRPMEEALRLRKLPSVQEFRIPPFCQD